MVACQSLLEENQLQALPTSYQGVSLVSQSVESAAPIPIIQFVGYLKLREVVSSPKAVGAVMDVSEKSKWVTRFQGMST
jgi:hypothetical protein